MQPRVVIFGVVANDYNTAAFHPARLIEVFQKLPERLAVEPVSFAAPEKQAIPQPDRSEVSDAAARRMVVDVIDHLKSSFSELLAGLAKASNIINHPRGFGCILTC